MFSKFSNWVYSMCRFFFFASYYEEVATVDPVETFRKAGLGDRTRINVTNGTIDGMKPIAFQCSAPWQRSTSRRLDECYLHSDRDGAHSHRPQFGIAQLVRFSDYNKNHTYDTHIMIFGWGYKPTNITGGWSFLWEASKLIDWLTGWPFSKSPCLVDTHLPTPDTMQGSIGAMVVLELSEDWVISY